MTFWMVLNNFEWGIKHANSLSVPRFTSEDASFKDDTLELTVATTSKLFKLYSSLK